MKNIFKDFLKFLTNRLFILFVIISILFYTLLTRFFELQIEQSATFLDGLDTKITKTIPIKASRGTILDRYGRPLAINRATYVILIERSMFDMKGRPLMASAATDNTTGNKQRLADDSLGINNLNEVLLQITKLLEKNGETFVDTMPISKTLPFEYTTNGNEVKELRYIRDILGSDTLWMSAADLIKTLRGENNFDIPKDWSDTDARNVLSLRCNLTLIKYLQYEPVVIAKDVSYETVVAIEENDLTYYGLQHDTEALREYPNGIYFSNLVGHTGKVSSEELKNLNENDYKNNDMVGKSGLELAFENYLRGTNGTMTVKVNNSNRKVATVSQADPVNGDKVFTTIDNNLQMEIYDIIMEYLRKILLSKMQGGSTNNVATTDTDILSSMVNTNNLSVLDIFNSKEGTSSYSVLEYIKSQKEDLNIYSDIDFKEAQTILKDAMKNGDIRPSEIIYTLVEQGIFLEDDPDLLSLRNGNINVKSFLRLKITDKSLSPAQIGLEPYSASVVLQLVETGETLAAVGYPNYDNNAFANSPNSEYLNKIFQDSTSPLINRPYKETLPPGSVFKMITGIAGLESGTINANTTIYDNITFKEASIPYPRCYTTSGHGSVNLASALEVSCNYFFFETSYKMGNSSSGNKLNSIETLNKYMIEFGLNDKSGVEISESQTGRDGSMNISSPSLKMLKENADWTDGNTIRTAIGQDFNDYTPAVMAKYISTIATKGTRYQSHLLQKIDNTNGELVKKFETVVENKFELQESTWNEIYEGMIKVTSGSNGTARAAFANFPIAVAGKTGTAESGKTRDSHTTFGGFAPFDNPEVAIYVIIPNGDYKGGLAPSSEIAKEVISYYFGLDAVSQLPVEKNSLVE